MSLAKLSELCDILEGRGIDCFITFNTNDIKKVQAGISVCTSVGARAYTQQSDKVYQATFSSNKAAQEASGILDFMEVTPI